MTLMMNKTPATSAPSPTPHASEAGPQTAPQMLSEMFLKVCAALDNANGLKWCIVSGYMAYPEDVKPHDVDIIVEPSRFNDMAQVLGHMPGIRIAQCILRESTAMRYEIVSYLPDGTPVILSLDVFSDVRYPGAIFMSADDFLATRVRRKDLFWVPSPAIEFGYYLLKKLEKSARIDNSEFTDDHGTRISELYAQDRGGSLKILRRLMEEPDVQVCIRAAAENAWDPVRDQRVRLWNMMLGKVHREHPLGTVGYYVADMMRRLYRIRRPTGLMVAILGPGSPLKDAMLDEIEATLLPQAFRGDKKFALRPPTRCPRGWRTTWIDYAFGYWRRVHPLLFRSRLVIFDRYFDDLVVHGKRAMSRLAPRPHLVIYLDAPTKGAKLREKYLAHVRGLSNGHVVDASRSSHEVTVDVERAILNYVCDRSSRRMGLSR